MSNWTHISGIIRIDQLPIFNENIIFTEEKLTNLIKENSPYGSEGGLVFSTKKTQVIEHFGNNCMSASVVWGLISFAGDLRDRDIDDLPNIIKWLENIPKKLNNYCAYIRQGIVSIEIEQSSKVLEFIYNWNNKKEKWEKILKRDKYVF